MATKLQIFNRAARAIGETVRIQSENETTLVASVIADVYDDFVRDLLSLREWPWSIAQTPLTEVSAQSIAYVGDDTTAIFIVPYDLGVDASQLTVVVNGVTKTLGVDYAYEPPDAGVGAKVVFAVPPAMGAAVTLTVNTSRVGWEHVFALPDDCVRPLALLGGSTSAWRERRGIVPAEQRVPFAVVPNNGRTGFLICSDEPDANVLEYVALTQNTSVYPPHFVEALVCRIASHLADAVKKEPREAQMWLQRMDLAIADAIAAANNGSGQPDVYETPGLTARW